MNDEFLERLAVNDPAHAGEPDLSRIKARVDAHTAPNVVPMTRRSQYGRTLRVAAAIGVLALAGGIGFAGGTYRAGNEGQSPLAVSSNDGSATAPGLDVGRQGVGVGGGMAPESSKVAGDYFGGYWGSVILKPGDGVTNTAGSAASYRFAADDVDAKALAVAIAKSLGISTDGLQPQDGGYAINDDKGAFNVYVGGDSMQWFNGYVNARSPWNCGNLYGGDSKEPSAAEQEAAQAKCDTEWPTPSKGDAIAAAKKVFASLGLDLSDGAQYSAYSYSSRLMTVVMTPVVDGMPVGQTWQAEVGRDGVFSVYGYAARIVKADNYPTVGARDAALRSELRKWQAFGPQQVFDANTAGNVTSTDGTAPVVRTKDGKPMLQGSISEAVVTGAQRSVMQVYLADGTSMLMPAWTYTAKDGSRWQMLAITEDYIDWQSMPTGGIAYEAGAMSK